MRLDEAPLQVVDIRDGLESTLALLEPQWGDRICVVRQLDEVPKIEAYAAELNQAFMTLLTNAGEAIEGEGTITVSTGRDGESIRVGLRDTGRGIPSDRLESIFDIGFANKSSRVRLHVGLANVRAIVDRHRGEIEVDSEPGRGTSFALVLPTNTST